MKKPTGVISNPVDVTLNLVGGAVATDNAQFSTAVTCATGAAVELFNKLVDVGVPLRLLNLQVNLLHKFEGNNGSLMGSLMFHWQARSEAGVPSGGAVAPYTGSYLGISATYSVGVGTLATVGGTLAGFLNVGSFPYAPVRIRLLGLGAPSINGGIKADSYVRIKGNVIPGT